MYDIQTTPGLIIDSRPYGEAGKILYIFTRDLGLVRVVAQGVRLEKSKLRYQAQNYSFGQFSLVRGKEYWRLVGVEANKTEDPAQSSKESWLAILAPLALLLKRLLQGEEAHPELFLCLEACDQFLKKEEKLGNELEKTLESVMVFRILDRLGYIGTDRSLDGELRKNELSLALIESLGSKRLEINKHINRALKESHL